MPVPSSGQLRLRADIALEVDGSATNTNVSLMTLANSAGFTDPDNMLEFYGYTNANAPSIQTNSATNIAISSMTLNGNVTADGGATVTSRGFYFGTSSNYASNSKITVGSGTGSFTNNRTGLSAGTTYYVTAFSINSAGESVGSTLGAATPVALTMTSRNIYQRAAWSGGGQYFPDPTQNCYYMNGFNAWQHTGTCSPRGTVSFQFAAGRRGYIAGSGYSGPTWSTPEETTISGGAYNNPATGSCSYMYYNNTMWQASCSGYCCYSNYIQWDV